MERLVLDGQALSKLREACSAVEIVDDSGKALGHFFPSGSEELLLEPQVSEEELDRREAAGGGRPLKEILADLRKS